MRWVLAIVLVALVAPAGASAATLRAGVGRSDVTPPTGFPTMGYVRSDAIARGQQTRLFARAIVLHEGDRKLALVATDLGFTPGGLLVDVAQRMAGRGFDERNVIISASHTHSAPAGFSNFQSDNFVAPTAQTPTDFKLAGDPQLYGFIVDRIALAIARADDDLGPARVGWGSSTLGGVTDNRSLEAHLANFGYDLPPGQGRVDEDPGGYMDTIDPNVDVLRVDRVDSRGRSVPMGGWLDFADHGTVNPFTFGVYNADHHGPASRIFESAVRREGHVPRQQDVVGAYGNSDAGDMTAAMRGRGPAYAEVVGSAEANAMLNAWREAGSRMSSSPAFDARWTKSCFCGRRVDGGLVASSPAMGFPFFTGSEENRGPLYDVTQTSNEGDRLPADVGPQGRKIPTVQPPVADFPAAAPLMVARIGDRAIATVPGEMTVEMGRRTRAAVQAAVGPAGVDRVVIVGYANEYLHYFTTPEEYEVQHYEGGSTLYGKYSSNLIKDDLTTLAGDLARGAPGPVPYDYDPHNGLKADFTPYEQGADHGDIEREPGPVQRLQRAAFAWRGGMRGFDRPLDRAFVAIERRARGRWRPVTDDLGLEMIWRVDDQGRYEAQWQVPLTAAEGSYRFVVTANRYRLESAPFRVSPSTALTVRTVAPNKVSLDYPGVDPATDLTARPVHADGGRIDARRHGHTYRIRRSRGERFSLPPGARIPVGSARDRYGNRNANAAQL